MKAFLDRAERLAGSWMLSVGCIAILAARLDTSFVTFLLLLIPFVNYTTKLEQLHAASAQQVQP